MTPILGQTANRAHSKQPKHKQGRPERADNSDKNKSQDRSRSSPNSHSPDSSFDALLATLNNLAYFRVNFSNNNASLISVSNCDTDDKTVVTN